MNALKYYNFALKSEPDNIELLANKALTLHAMNDYISAIELYKELALVMPCFLLDPVELVFLINDIKSPFNTQYLHHACLYYNG